jgi:3-hydroxyacyl-[acyl-carrier protein] dehydratase/trans-2-decenoyl-[acyl-carrier protein] isomerase
MTISRLGGAVAVGPSPGGPFGEETPQLPIAPLLGFDAIRSLTLYGGDHGFGGVEAFADVTRFKWAFDCHFVGDPVLPGALMLDALFQLTGFYAAAHGFQGKGRAAGVRSVRFLREITPASDNLEYRVSVRRLSGQRQLIVADGEVVSGTFVCVRAAGMIIKVVPYPTT